MQGFISGFFPLFHWCICLFMPVSHCFNYCSFVISFEISSCEGRPRGDSQLVDCLTLAQVVMSWFMSSSPASDSLLSAWKPTSDLLSPFLFAPPPLARPHTRALSHKNKTFTKMFFLINCEIFSFVLLFQDCLGSLESLEIPYEF